MSEKLADTCGVKNANAEKDWYNVVQGVKTLIINKNKNAAFIFPLVSKIIAKLETGD